MLQVARIAAGRGLFGRLLAPCNRQAPLPLITATQPPSSGIRARPRVLLGWVAALLAMFAVVAPASAQRGTMTIVSATPTTFSGAGQTITFQVAYGGSNAITNTIELTSIAYGPVGPLTCTGLPLPLFETATCSFTYVTQPTDGMNLNQSGSYKVITGGGASRSGAIPRFDVPYVPVPPTATISAATSNVTEDGAQSLTYTVTLSTPAAAPISVNYSLGGSADGADYAASGNPLVIATGSTTGTITVDPTADTAIEDDEEVIVSLAAGSGYTLGSPTSATGMIVNDDVPTLAINNVTVGEGNAGTVNAVFTVTLSAASTRTVTVNYATANATATAGSDYTAQSGTLTFTPGQTTQTVTVPVIGETLPEANETFTIGLSAAANATIATATGTGTITNDDMPVTLSSSLPFPTVGVAYNEAVTASGGNGSYTFAVISGTLPTGLTLSPSGAISGTPTAGGSFIFRIAATDTSAAPGPYSGSLSYSVVVAAPTLVLTPAAGTLTLAYGAPYSQNITASGGTGPYSYSLAAGALPLGVSLSSTGQLSGTPTVPGSYPITVVATDSSTGSGAPYAIGSSYVLQVGAPTITISPATLPDGAMGAAYSVDLSASGGVAPYSYSLLSGALPVGMTFSSAGQFSGTPRSAGNFTLTVRATDSNGQTASRVFSFNIAPPTLTITPATLPDGTTHIAYSQSLTTSGGIAPYSYSVVSGSLPIGVSFSSAGVFSGTPTTAGSYTVTISSTDDAGYNATVGYTINVTSPSIVIDPPTLDAAVVGDAYTMTLTASGGVAPYSYSLVSGALPPGTSFNSSGALAGTPTMSGSYTFGVRATDSNGNSGLRTYTLVVDSRTLVLTPASLTSATAGAAYSATFNASGGIGAYHYVLSAGALPAGLSLGGSSGVLSGTPTVSGAFSFAITVNDSGGGTPGMVTATYSLAVASPTLALTPATLPDGSGGIAYSQTLTASGGIAPYSYAVTTGSLPAGLTLTAAGQLSGTPTVAGSFAFSVTATDSTAGVAGTAVHNYTLVLAAPVIVISPATVPNGMRGVAYSQTMSASGGTAGYTFAVTAGSLPTGLTLSAAGVLSGTPTVAASNNFTVTATDALGFSASQGYTQTIAETVPVANADAATTLGAAAATLAVTANDTGLIDTIAITTTPANGTVVVTGLTAVYTANANYSGTDTFAYTATGPGGTSAPALVTVTINPVAMAVSRTVAAVAGMPVTVDLTQGATGGPFTAATLVALNPATSGTATIAQIGTGASAVYRLTYTPVSSYSGAATASFTLSNAFSTSAQAVITFDVAPRPDPAQDAEVRGLLNAQAASTRRFASSQINNFQQRLERLHGGNERNGFDNGLSVATDQRCEQKVGAIPGRTCDRNSPGAEFDGGSGPAGSGLQSDPANALGTGSASGPAFGVWAGGMIRSGNQDGRNGSATVDFETDGVSFGADYRFNDAFVFGAGVGYGRDDSDIGEHGSRSEGDAFTLAAYASYSPGERFFLDGLVGYQQLNYDLRRYVTVNANTVAGSRDGDQWFASVSAGADIQNGDWQLTPYARVDMAQATLDGYTESGDPLYSLAYGDMDVDTTTGNLGVRVDYRVRTGWGLFSPQLRLEYQHDFQGNGAAAMQYADFLTGPSYRAELDDFDRNRVNVGLGGLFGFDTWSLRLEYRGLIGSGGDSDHGVLLNIEKRL